MVTPVANIASAARKSAAPKAGRGGAGRSAPCAHCRVGAATPALGRARRLPRIDPMTLSPARGAARRARLDRAVHRLIAVTVLGFASGLPLALTGQAMQAWLSADGIDIATIGFLSLVGLPYTFKFLWAPLMDRFEPPWLGRRRGWLVADPARAGRRAAAGWRRRRRARRSARSPCSPWLVALLSASQDVVVDAYRTDLLPAAERGIGSSLTVLGYRLAMILSGGIAFIWVDPRQGGGWSWPEVYRAWRCSWSAPRCSRRCSLPRLVDAPRRRSASRATTCSAFSPCSRRSRVGFVVTRYAFAPLARAAGRAAA